MTGWIWFWGILLFTTLVLYALLAVSVTIGGLADIRQMLKSLSEEERDSADTSADEEKI